MAEKLTNEQQAAVDSRERSLLVSAAAGSGKTKVLVERLFSYVEREGANLDDFLIITYTRAAASELRGKIAKALTERMERDPGNYHLRQQMLRVYRADIKTVDAFCTALLRENCHLLGEDARGHALRPDFRVLDENEAQVLRERVLARTLDDFYDCLTPGGTLLADTLGAGRDDSALEDLVLELHAKLQAQPYEDKWLEAQRAFWRAVPDKIEDTPYGKILLNEVRRKARHCKNLLQRAAQEMCANDALNQKYAPAFLDASYQLEALEGKTAEGWDAARGVTIAFPRLAAVKDSDGGEIVVSAREELGRLLITVSDDGRGMSEESLRRFREGGRGGEHLGLRNVDAILRLHYGDAYGLRFPPVSGHGTCVAISLPAVRKEEDEC